MYILLLPNKFHKTCQLYIYGILIDKKRTNRITELLWFIYTLTAVGKSQVIVVLCDSQVVLSGSKSRDCLNTNTNPLAGKTAAIYVCSILGVWSSAFMHLHQKAFL